MSAPFRISLVLLAALALAAGATGASSGTPGKRPYRVSGVWLCPTGYDYVAYRRYRTLRRIYYPPFHPARPSYSVRPTRCFRSAQQAQRVGYHTAPLPPGTEDVDGIYLVPPDRALRVFCISAARYAHIAIPCPGLVPESPSAVSGCGRCAGDGYLFLEAFVTAPSWYAGGGGGHGLMHLWFVGFRVGLFPDEPCRDGIVERALQIRGQPGQLIACPPGQSTHSDHVVARWEENGAVYEVSLHNHTNVNRDLVIEMAQHVRLVSPS
ncbi:MAG: hypothetical protein WBB74_10320 [Gaiellaceae bacterium]